MKRLMLFLALTIITAATPAVAENINIKAGLWQLSATMEFPGMAAIMPVTTIKECLSSDNAIPQQQQQEGNCTIKDQRVTGNTVSYTMVCNGDGNTSESKGSFTYEGTKMHGSMDINSNGMHIKTKYTGTWLGPCNQ